MNSFKGSNYRLESELYNNAIFRLFHIDANESDLYRFGFIKQPGHPTDNKSQFTANFDVKTGLLSLINKENDSIIIRIESDNILQIKKQHDEHFHGFGFQRKVFDANGTILEFKKDYRWNEATVPYFISSAGYGIFSANPNDHVFDFSQQDHYNIQISKGFHDIYIITGPSYKSIIEKYTSITGRPIMIPKWAFGVCYAARLFENQEGLLNIARRFRSEGIPCDMIGVEPGWEEHYYQMKWEWSKTMFPSPGKMIDELHELGYAFELWDSGDAPLSGFTDNDIREKWFAERINTSLALGVDFFKQDDPYPRCITSEEMVTNPEVTEQNSEDECINIANTLYTETIFNAFRRITGKRTMIIFHSYASSFSSHIYPAVWAGDFKLGNGAINASLSGHSMVTQDMRSEVPDGIHFGFLMPFVFMDSWAYYLEPWLFAPHIRDMICFYARLRSSLFPYLYTTFRESHTTGLPMLRPLMLEYQDDPKACSLENQFLLGDSFMVCATAERGNEIYLPEGRWINYWTNIEYESHGMCIKADWPVYAGGGLFVKSGSIIPKCPSYDSLSQYKNDIYIIEVFPDRDSKIDIYEDDGISYDYENKGYALTPVSVNSNKNHLDITIGKTTGSYKNMPDSKKYIVKIYSQTHPIHIRVNNTEIDEAMDKRNLLCSRSPGWIFSNDENYIYIKPQQGWQFTEYPEDEKSFYGCKTIGSNDTNSEIAIHINAESDILTQNISKSLPSDSYAEPLYFNLTVNPPFRVKLNHGDNWLPYYMYAGFEIIDTSGNIVPVNKLVTMEIITSENTIMNFSTQSYMGTGHFGRINLADAGTSVTALIKLFGEGIEPYEFKYIPLNDV